jgi:hypothetical protein
VLPLQTTLVYGNNSLDMTIYFDPVSGIMSYDLDDGSGSAMFLYDFFEERMASSLGVQLDATTDPSSDVATRDARVTSTTTGVSELAIDFDGTFSPGDLMERLGINFTVPPPAAGGITLSNATLTYTATGNVSLVIDADVTVPTLGIARQPVTFTVLPGPIYSLQVGGGVGWGVGWAGCRRLGAARRGIRAARSMHSGLLAQALLPGPALAPAFRVQ